MRAGALPPPRGGENFAALERSSDVRALGRVRAAFDAECATDLALLCGARSSKASTLVAATVASKPLLNAVL